MADSTTPNTPNIDTLAAGNTQLADIGKAIDTASVLSNQRPRRNAIGDLFHGINHRGIPAGIPINRDYHGLIFFTRPCLNMSLANLRKDRIFNPLLTTNTQTYEYMFRCMLDTNFSNAALSDGGTTSFIDDQQGFMPFLTNLATSATGFQDIALNAYESHEGAYGERWGMIDSIAKNYTSYDINVSFRNIPGDPITSFFFYWCHYMAAVMEGQLMPYPDFVLNNEIDYQTRIYRLVLDSTRTTVQKISATGASMPMNDPIGASFDFTTDRPINDANHAISIQFKSYGALYTDQILIQEFNQVTIARNPTMADGVRTLSYTQVPLAALTVFNNQGYPRINPDTYELEWWVSNDVYAYLLPTYTQYQALQAGTTKSYQTYASL